MKLGPIQTAWIEEMLAHPERQLEGQLGLKEPNSSDFRACCLGQLGICYNTAMNLPIEWKEDKILIIDKSKHTLERMYDKVGLLDTVGSLRKIVSIDNSVYPSLASMNDTGKLSWIQIAEYVKSNPNNVFTKEV